MRAAIYARVSTDNQTTENQIQALVEVLTQRGWMLVEVFKDEGISGAKGRDERPALRHRAGEPTPPRQRTGVALQPHMHDERKLVHRRNHRDVLPVRMGKQRRVEHVEAPAGVPKRTGLAPGARAIRSARGDHVHSLRHVDLVRRERGQLHRRRVLVHRIQQ